MARMMIAITLTALGITSALATAATGPAVPAFITAKSNNIIYVQFPLADQGGTPPACAANIGGTMVQYALDNSTTGGRAELAVLLTAYATGATVWFGGTGTCTIDPVTENLGYAQLMPQ